MTRIKHEITVILDLGNVVLDWNVERILAALDLEAGELELLRSNLFFHQDWLDMDHGKATEACVVSRVCARSGLARRSVDAALSAARNSLQPIGESILLMEEISDSGIEMHCLSNMSRETWDHIRDYELFGMFSGIVISGIEGCMKPDEDIFRLAIDRFELDPAQTLFVDDSLANIETSQRLGFDSYHFRRSPNCYTRLRKMIFA